MTTQRLSALASLLLEDEAAKIQAFSILKSKLQAPFVEEFTKKYDYSQEDALILFKKSCEMLFEQYIWNPHLLADDSSRKKGDKYEKMRNTFFYYFLRITQGISKPEEWDMLASLVEIALHEKLYFEPYLDKEANVNEDRGILLGYMNRKQVCFDYLYEKHKNHVTQYIQNNFSRIPKEDAKSIRNDSFIKANQLINAEDCLVEEFRRIWFCISWLINHPNKSYKDFVFVSYVKNIVQTGVCC